MTVSPELAFQGAAVAALKADAGVVALLGNVDGSVRVHDRVPETVVFPYVSIGPSQHTQQDATCMLGAEVFLQIDVWSREPGYVEAKTVAAAVRAALHGKTLTASHITFDVEHRFTNTIRDPDGMTSHAVLSFQADIYTSDE